MNEDGKASPDNFYQTAHLKSIIAGARENPVSSPHTRENYIDLKDFLNRKFGTKQTNLHSTKNNISTNGYLNDVNSNEYNLHTNRILEDSGNLRDFMPYQQLPYVFSTNGV